MSTLTDDDRRYIRSRLMQLEYGDMERAIDCEADARADQAQIIAEVTYWSQVLSEKIPMRHEALVGK